MKFFKILMLSGAIFISMLSVGNAGSYVTISSGNYAPWAENAFDAGNGGS